MSSSATAGSTHPASTPPASPSAPSPTSTAPAPRGSPTPTPISTNPSALLTDGCRPTRANGSSIGSSRSMPNDRIPSHGRAAVTGARWGGRMTDRPGINGTPETRGRVAPRPTDIPPGPTSEGPISGNPPLDTESAKAPWDLLAAINAGRLVPFLGAGVSMVPPTKLPSAAQLAKRLIARGYGAAGDDLEEIAEKCWERGSWQLFAQALATEDWRSREPNICHEVMAQLAAEGLLPIILTTNWDTTLETALSRQQVLYTCVSRPADLAIASPIAVRVVKLHGCVETPETVRARRAEVTPKRGLTTGRPRSLQ